MALANTSGGSYDKNTVKNDRATLINTYGWTITDGGAV